jgi:hypothetical protein
MAAAITVMLSDLTTGDIRRRLEDLLAPGGAVSISCNGQARLSAAFLAAALSATGAGGFLRLDGLSPAALSAVEAVDPEHRLAVGSGARPAGPGPVGDRPYQVSLAPDGTVTISMLKGVGQHRYMNESASHEWVRGLDAPAVVVDLAQIEHLNSLLVAWLLQLNQGAGPGRCRLANVGRQAVAQLTQLRLNHMLTIA